MRAPLNQQGYGSRVVAIRLLIAAVLSVSCSLAFADDAFQRDVDSAVQEIMLTRTGQAICQRILGAQAEAIEFHLGVSSSTAEAIMQSCTGEPNDKWVFATSYQDIRKLTLKAFKPRKYVLLSAEINFPIESWTDPFSNTTVLLAGHEGISHERLVQLLAHEMAVYFDSKANPAHPDAQNIPLLRDLELTSSAKMNPLVAVSDPLIAHTMTYVRALQVEFSIVDELIQMHKIIPPADQADPYLNFLISDKCAEECLEELVATMRATYLPIGLPLLAFAPHYRALLSKELARARPILWHQGQWARVQESLNTLPVEFLKTQFTGNPLADLQKIFLADASTQPAFVSVSKFLRDDLWALERPALSGTHLISSNASFLEFMKVPLLSGYNILLSSGPRVRVRTGNSE